MLRGSTTLLRHALTTTRRAAPNAHHLPFSSGLRSYATDRAAQRPPAVAPSSHPYAARSRSQYNDVIQIPQQQGPGQIPQRQGARQPEPKGGPHLLLLVLGLAVTPVITYYYWQYREAHMIGKKTVMLKEIREKHKAKVA